MGKSKKAHDTSSAGFANRMLKDNELSRAQQFEIHDFIVVNAA